MKKLYVIILLFPLSVTSFLFAQTGSTNRKQIIFNLPPSVPVPHWVTLIDWDHPNIHKIDAAIAASGIDEVHAHTSEEEESNEEPYRMAYERWRRKMAPFIQEDGSIVEQPDYYNRLLSIAIDAQSKNKQLGARAQNAGARIAGSTSNANWTILGPIETYDENNTKIPEQVNVYTIAIAPSDPTILYAGAETGGIFRSADKGLHWVCISDSLPPFTATSIAVDPANPNTIYAITGDGQLIKTVDAGSSWSMLPAYKGGGSEKITISKTTGRILIAGDKGVYYSNDGGATWPQGAGSTEGHIYDVEINATNPNLVYAVGAQANASNTIVILKSSDGGARFTTVKSAALSNMQCYGARFGVTPANGNTVYCINLDTLAPQLLKSTDGGASWSVTVTGHSTALDMENWQGFYDLDIMVSPNNANQLIVGDYHALKSTDGGHTFTSLSDDGPFTLHTDIQCMRAVGNDAYIATDGGVNYSTDFFTNVNNCSARNYGLTGSDFWGFGQGWDQDIVVGGRYHNGDAALFENYGIGNSLCLEGGENATGHVFHGQKNVVGFSDLGTMQIPSSLPGTITNTDYANTLWPQDDDYGLFIGKLMIDPCFSNTYYTGRDSILWKSVNYGTSYSALHNFDSRIWRFDIARSNRNVIYVCAGNGIYKTTDGGNSWITVKLPAGVTYAFYNADIAVDQQNENIVFLCMANGNSLEKVFKSTDGGSTWVNYTGMLSDQYIAYIVPQAGTNGGVYAIESQPPTKVYYRDNTMSDWIDYSAGY